MSVNEKEINDSLNRRSELDSILNKLSEYYSSLEKESITREDIFDSLYLILKDKYDWEHPLDFWDLDINYTEAESLLSDFNFKTVLFKVESNEDIISHDLLMQFKVKIKSKGLIWLIHKNDADPFPSNPHAHQMDSGLKLDLSNGKCYKKTKLVSMIKKKDLIIIRNQASRNFDLPELDI